MIVTRMKKVMIVTVLMTYSLFPNDGKAFESQEVETDQSSDLLQQMSPQRYKYAQKYWTAVINALKLVDQDA